MAEPLVSVSMITYNHAPYIAKAIEGVLQQKVNFPIELVIGEDRSTDGTREIVLEYQKKYPDIIRVITSDKNVGAKRNDYLTHKACRGKYIAYCEGDDYWHNLYKLQKQVDYMENHPKCSLVCSDYDEVLVATGKRIQNVNRKEKLNPSRISEFRHFLSGSTGIQTCTVMLRKDLSFQVIDSDPILHQSQRFVIGDLPKWAEISRLGDIAYIDESLATYNRLPESATASADVTKILRTSILNKELILYLIDKYALPGTERARHTGDLWRRRLKLAFYEGNQEGAEESKKYIGKLSLAEWLQFGGAKNAYLNRIFKPILHLACRDLIPTAK